MAKIMVIAMCLACLRLNVNVRIDTKAVHIAIDFAIPAKPKKLLGLLKRLSKIIE